MGNSIISKRKIPKVLETPNYLIFFLQKFWAFGSSFSFGIGIAHNKILQRSKAPVLWLLILSLTRGANLVGTLVKCLSESGMVKIRFLGCGLYTREHVLVSGIFTCKNGILFLSFCDEWIAIVFCNFFNQLTLTNDLGCGSSRLREILHDMVFLLYPSIWLPGYLLGIPPGSCRIMEDYPRNPGFRQGRLSEKSSAYISLFTIRKKHIVVPRKFFGIWNGYYCSL